jgi:hypothetical protein
MLRLCSGLGASPGQIQKSSISSMASLLESVVQMINYNSTISSMASSLLESVVQMINYNSTISSMASLLESVVQMNNYNSKFINSTLIGYNNTLYSSSSWDSLNALARPHPSSLLLGKSYSSDVTGDGPALTLGERQWEPIIIDFSSLSVDKASSLLWQFAEETISLFCPGYSRQCVLYRQGYLSALPSLCGRDDLHSMSRRFISHGLNSLTVPEMQLLAFTSIESLISSWRRLPRSRSRSPDHHSWNRYLEYLATIASFGNECWIIAHASLCWLPMLVKTTTSSSVIDQYWEQMTLIRKKFVRRLQRSYPALSDWRSVVKYYPRIRRSSLARTTPRIVRQCAVTRACS